MQQPRLFLDIETIPDPTAVLLLPDPEAPSNYKDPAKIDAYVVEKRVKQLNRAALDPDTGQICAAAFQVGTGGVPTVLTHFKLDERAILDAAFAALASTQGRCVGYNILRFDLPFLLRRAFALGMKLGELAAKLTQKRGAVEPVTDLMSILYNWSLEDTKGLQFVVDRYGLGRDPAIAAVDHSMIKDLDEPTLMAVAADDVRATIELFDRMNSVYFNL